MGAQREGDYWRSEVAAEPNVLASADYFPEANYYPWHENYFKEAGGASALQCLAAAMG
ncbi:hypothetical protein Cflav_PD3772 [Pedosphaera parvula Ellin514]|uniref:Uncharacterized protein n=1 Tax=Pedosphaera parvula (strain Ellin514) TaxID=320771 RepID=B9XGK4_PEDPL|nr:hypothetical protein Cflav_PD3772 [Pedosphaera parvula Ellin514]